MFETCPFHAFDDVMGVWVGDDVGHSFTCPRSDHHVPGPFTWFRAPELASISELSGLSEELRLDVTLPAALREYRGIWVEYGILERAYALANAADWAFLIQRYSHTAIAAKRYTATAFLVCALGRLWRRGALCCRGGRSTGRWVYCRDVSWWALPPEPEWENRLSFADSDFTVEYVPGQVEM